MNRPPPFEEERLPWYTADQFYPVHIGEIFISKYKVVGKLGYGAYSTFNRDSGFVAVKVCTRQGTGSLHNDRELEFYKHVSSLNSQHNGQAYIRNLLETFKINGPDGEHLCLVQPPMHMTIQELQRQNPSKRLNKQILNWTLFNLLNINPSNIMLTIEDISLLTNFEQAEMENPSPTKLIDETRTIYGSRKLDLPKDSLWGQPVLCDFGEARLGWTHKGVIQPELYRAPEVLFNMEWGCSVDIWNVAVLIWDLFEGQHLFHALDEAEESSASHHVAEMVGYLGMPPLEYLRRSEVTKNVFDDQGCWKGTGGVNVPETSLEQAEIVLDGEEKKRFLNFFSTMSQPSATRKRPEPSGDRTTSKTRSSADPAFEQNMIDAGIYPADYDPDDGSISKPANMDEIQAALRVPRRSLSPSRFPDSAFEGFKKRAIRANGEMSARVDVITIIQGNGQQQHRHGADHVFNHLEPLDKELPKPKADQYDGALPQSIDRSVRRDLGKYIVPCTNTARPAVPNFILEAKGAGGHADVLRRQACHHGALGARAVFQLENYQATEPQYNQYAKSFSCTYHHGTSTLALYSHHITQPKVPGAQPEYHMTQLNAYAMTGNPISFREGATAFRNLRDLSQTYRDSAIDHANQVARKAPANSPSTLLTDTQTSLSAAQDNTSDTSGYETPDEHTTAKRSRHDGPVHPRASPVAATPGHIFVPVSESDIEANKMEKVCTVSESDIEADKMEKMCMS
ncbi:hypothetical protein DV735_g3437, partial [Chaetothyriales sp. CBS 134920]